MKHYELTYLISPDLSEKDVKVIQEKIQSAIQKENGALIETKIPLKRKMGYPLGGKQEEAYIAIANFNLSPEKIEIVEKEIRGENKIIRYMITFQRPIKKFEATRKRSIPGPGKKSDQPKGEKAKLKEIEEKLEEILAEQ